MAPRVRTESSAGLCRENGYPARRNKINAGVLFHYETVCLRYFLLLRIRPAGLCKVQAEQIISRNVKKLGQGGKSVIAGQAAAGFPALYTADGIVDFTGKLFLCHSVGFAKKEQALGKFHLVHLIHIKAGFVSQAPAVSVFVRVGGQNNSTGSLRS